ncbi:MAG: hypothetical protein JWM28_1020 [Chitinophagaceae bacterium]|nr:hypothetical protein [Chitinophagaceae bacterium]
MSLVRIFILLIVLISGQVVNSQKNAVPLKRKDSFFGLHFDFHAGKQDKNIGETLTSGMIDSLLTLVKPDFVQVDCKGHPGISSYPTKVGTPAGSFVKDPLRIWRDGTAKHGVALYVHYSGIYDVQAIQLHPDWGVVNAEGKIDSNNTSVHSAYTDQLLIPQLKELSKEYGLNGAWIDGDCWATVPDYSPASLKEFSRQTGIITVPRSSNDSGYAEFMDFNRKSFLDYVQHYTRAIHQFNPDFQVASNWAFSSFMPQPVTVDVDFISGDLTPDNSVNNAAFEARCIASQARKYNKPWDIMSWGFTMSWDRNTLQTQKSIVQLTQEAAEIIAVGGGFQCYFTQNRDASIKPWQIPVMKGLGDFMRLRRQFCKGAAPVPQIAVLYSGEAHRRNRGSLFSSDGLRAIRGITTALLDAQQSIEVLMEHHLQGNMNQYPLIVIPEWDYLLPSFRDELLNYVSQGGKLLVIGAKATRMFEKEGAVEFKAQPTSATRYLGLNGNMAALEGLAQPAVLLKDTKPVGGLYDGQDFRFHSIPAASIAKYGSGQIACVFMDMGNNYQDNQSTTERDFLNDLVHELFKDPVVNVKGSHLVHVVVNRLDRKMIIHLINTGGQHANKTIYAYDEVPVVGPLTIEIKHSRPSRVMLEPEHKELQYTFIKDKITVKVPQLAIHSMVVVE